jgi:hypothetical protein
MQTIGRVLVLALAMVVSTLGCGAPISRGISVPSVHEGQGGHWVTCSCGPACACPKDRQCRGFIKR